MAPLARRTTTSGPCGLRRSGFRGSRRGGLGSGAGVSRPGAADAGCVAAALAARTLLLLSSTARGDAEHHVPEGGPRLPGPEALVRALLIVTHLDAPRS